MTAPTIVRPDQGGFDAQSTSVRPDTDVPGSHSSRDDQEAPAAGDQTRPHDQAHREIQPRPVVGTPNLPGSQPIRDAQRADAAGDQTDLPAEATRSAAPIPCPPRPVGPLLADPTLALLADSLDDLERTKIATGNRLRHMTRDVADSDGHTRGLGLPDDDPSVATVAAIYAALDAQEHQSTLALQRALRRHPLGAWMKAQKGIGEKQGARLLASIGDPAWNDLHNRPRTVSELRSYCGYGPIVDGVVQRRRKGQVDNWSATAKMRAFLIAEKCMMTVGGTYRPTYDEARVKYADATHQHDCLRCGPAGKPALAGSPLSAGHQHARALRIVTKTILRDLWRESMRLHAASQTRPHDHSFRDAQTPPVVGTLNISEDDR